MPERFRSEWSNFRTAPKWRIWLWAAILVFAVAYLAWCRWGAQTVKPGQVFGAVTSSKVADMERKAVMPKKLMVFTPKAEALKKLGLSPARPHIPGLPVVPGIYNEPQPDTVIASTADEEVFEATDAPPSRFGTTTVTFANLSTGMPRSVIVVKKAPIFRWERSNTAGVEYGIGPHGRYYQGDYQRDICSVKGVVLAGRMSVTSYPSETDWRLGIRAEYRW